MTSHARQSDATTNRRCTRFISGVLAAFLILISTTSSVAQTPAVEPGAQDVKTRVMVLIQRLESDDFAQREKAMVQLRAEGPAARPYLVRAKGSASLDVRLRIEELISLLPTGKSADNTKRESARVNVDLTDATLAEALEAVAGSSGIKILPNGMPTDRLLTLSIKDAPILNAVDQLADALDASWHLDGRLSIIRLVAAGINSPHRIYSGPTRIAAERFMNNRSLSFGGQPLGSCYVQLRIDVDPAAHLIGLWQPLQESTITDSKGKALSQPANRTARFQSVAGRSTHSFTLPMANPSTGAQSLALLEGTVELAFPKSYEQVTLPMPEPGAKSDGGHEGNVGILSTSPANAPRRVVVIEAKRQSLQVDGVVNTQVQDRRVTFLMVDGTRVEVSNLAHPRRQGENEVFTIPIPAGDVEAVQFQRLSAIRTEKVRFSFRDLPLP